MLIKNKKGWVAVVEACLAIVILFTFLMLAFNKENQKTSKTDFYGDAGKSILFQTENNDSFRNFILENRTSEVNDFVSVLLTNFDSRLNSGSCIANISDYCSTDMPEKKEIISYDFFVAANETNNLGKKLKVFLWLK
jgi:hypothetical protein